VKADRILVGDLEPGDLCLRRADGRPLQQLVDGGPRPFEHHANRPVLTVDRRPRDAEPSGFALR